jgi:hypothetical protein
VQDLAQYAVDDDVTQSLDFLLLCVDVRKSEPSLVRNVYVLDGRRGRDDLWPQTHCFEHALSAARQSSRSIVKTWLVGGSTPHWLNHGNSQLQWCQCQRQAGTYHAAAGNNDIVVMMVAVSHAFPDK